MSEDIIARLRNNDCFYKTDCMVIAEAAAEIERLRGALREIALVGAKYDNGGDWYHREIARAALANRPRRTRNRSAR